MAGKRTVAAAESNPPLCQRGSGPSTALPEVRENQPDPF